KLVALGINAV
nr:Chain P, 10-meric peptide from Genome polyprotein [Hepacivirus hominis]5JZI_C Chain C, KLV peptide [Hepacivirus hominis]5JZI_H Chain H, KLV peptide [Hepacivirus hominis]5YXN_I Chain I, NS3 peptide [Hepacivirus hominis]5YXU_I Chain I, LYS-LEU-VAL-ALA-LEU-GLY-ILE-ASN-ALA-VAL [Hepacivirus hominis]5YXU_J Chain J, LYS-LEU-VAL-ALA-LEU-GLY-ILE-ASN-ALA-VAL [Hepacivirus hominis]